MSFTFERLPPGPPARRPDPATPSFRERYCLARSLTQEEYADTMLRACLYPHARWFSFLLPPDFFHPDRDFINAFGLIRSHREALGEIRDFQSSEVNRHHFARRWLRLRLSMHRVQRTLHTCWEK